MTDLFNETPTRKRGQKRGDNTLSESDRERLVMSVVGMVKKLASSHYKTMRRAGRSFEFEELVAEASAASVEAARIYDPASNRGKFSTFASSWVKVALKRFTDPRALEVGELGDVERVAYGGLIDHSCPNPSDDPTDSDDLSDISESTLSLPFGGTAGWLLGRLRGQTREIVVRVCVDGIAPDAVAVQMGILLKDVKLALRNAVAILQREGDGEDVGAGGQSIGEAEEADNGKLKQGNLFEGIE